MKKSKAKNILDKVILSFGKKIAAIRFESTFTISSFGDARVALTKRIKTLKDTGQLKFRGMWSAAPATDLTRSDRFSFALGAQQAQDRELLQILVSNLNNQHLWFLSLGTRLTRATLKTCMASLVTLIETYGECAILARPDQMRSAINI
jgi:hypothetical protein